MPKKKSKKANKGGRPATGQMPSITFRGDKPRYEAKAAADGLSLSDWIRSVCNKASGR